MNHATVVAGSVLAYCEWCKAVSNVKYPCPNKPRNRAMANEHARWVNEAPAGRLRNQYAPKRYEQVADTMTCGFCYRVLKPSDLEHTRIGVRCIRQTKCRSTRQTFWKREARERKVRLDGNGPDPKNVESR